MFQNRRLEGVWAALGRLLGRFWLSHGSKASLGCLLYGSWAALGRLLSRLGHLLGGSWAVCGTKLGRLGGILEVFWWDFPPKWSQVGIKIKKIIELMLKLPES